MTMFFIALYIYLNVFLGGGNRISSITTDWEAGLSVVGTLKSDNRIMLVWHNLAIEWVSITKPVAGQASGARRRTRC